MDEGQGSLKIMLQILTEDYINDCIEHDVPVNSINTLFILAIANTKESYESSAVLYQLAAVDKLFGMALDGVIKDCILCSDLSQINTLFGLKGGNTKFPCVKCKYESNLTKKRKTEINPVGSFQPRTSQDWVTCRNKLRDAANNKKSDFNLSVFKEPIGSNLLPSLLEKDCISPPPLHIFLGLHQVSCNLHRLICRK